MKKENLIIIAGMPRAGTSYMYQVLSKHPKIFVPIIKETNYFSYNQEKGISWFENLYKKATDQQKLFDISPFYFLDDNFFHNVTQFNKNQKVILFLREPNDWVKSLYKQLKKQSYNLPDYTSYVDGCELSFENHKLYLNFKNFDYIGKVEKFKKKFKKNLLLIDFEYFQKDKVKVLNEIENFIGVENVYNENNIIKEKINAGNVTNNKFITYLSTIHFLREIAFKILPNKVIHYIRNRFILGIPVTIDEQEEYNDIYNHKYLFQEHYFKEKPIVWY